MCLLVQSDENLPCKPADPERVCQGILRRLRLAKVQIGNDATPRRRYKEGLGCASEEHRLPCLVHLPSARRVRCRSQSKRSTECRAKLRRKIATLAPPQVEPFEAGASATPRMLTQGQTLKR